MIGVYLKLLRIPSWTKNIFVFAPAFFAGVIFDWPIFLNVLLSATAFCFVASTVYVLNDSIDYENDRKHPTKKWRPLATGTISRKKAIGVLAALAALDIIFFSFLDVYIVSILISYILLNALYSFYLKHVAIADILLVASFYVLRVMAGGFAAEVPVSGWLTVTTFFLALLLILGKRKAELFHGFESQRPVLAEYSETFLNIMLAVAATLTIISYSSYILIVHQEPLAVYTIFFILLGIMRYLQFVYDGHGVESPEKIVWQDKVILLSVVCWAVLMYFIFYPIPIL